MQDRIDKLEGLVLSLMTNGGETAGPAAASQALAMDSSGFQDSPSMVDESIQDEEEGSETDGVAKSLGVLHMTNQKSMYIGEGHWAAILKDVCYPPPERLVSTLTRLRFMRSRTSGMSIKSNTTTR
jgi:hypothetical protein